MDRPGPRHRLLRGGRVSLESAQKAFEKGLAATVKEHLKLYGSIEKMLVVAPKEEWDVFYSNTGGFHTLSQVSFHDMQPTFDAIVFLAKAA